MSVRFKDVLRMDGHSVLDTRYLRFFALYTCFHITEGQLIHSSLDCDDEGHSDDEESVPLRDGMEESVILDRMGHPDVVIRADAVASGDEILTARELVDQIHMDERVSGYILDIVFATRLATGDLSDRQDASALETFRPLIH